MKLLKSIFFFVTLLLVLWACGSSPIKKTNVIEEQPVVIANDSLQYEIIIIDIGFNLFLNSIAHPAGYYSQEYLESRNQIFVTNWNIRASNPAQFNNTIYQNIIDYQPNIDYGYEVNYKLFNYFMFAQQKYKINLGLGNSNRIR